MIRRLVSGKDWWEAKVSSWENFVEGRVFLCHLLDPCLQGLFKRREKGLYRDIGFLS